MKQIFLLIVSFTIFACSSENDNKGLNSVAFSDVYSVEADSVEVDLIGSNSENAFYLTYSANNGFNENLLRYDLTSQIVTEIVHPDLGQSTQLEIVNNFLYSLAKGDIYRYDLDLSNETFLSNIGFNRDHLRTAVYDGNIWMLPGINEYATYNVASNNFTWDILGMSGEYWSQGAFEVINDVAYCFGGANYFPTVATNKIRIYDFLNDNWSYQVLPFNVYESFTATYNNSIIVAGNKNTDSSQPFLYVFDPITNSFSEFETDFNFAGKTIRGVAVVNQDLYIAYAALPISNSTTIKIAKGSLP